MVLEKLIAGAAVIVGVFLSCQGIYNGIRYDRVGKSTDAQAAEAIAGCVLFSMGGDYSRKKLMEERNNLLI